MSNREIKRRVIKHSIGFGILIMGIVLILFNIYVSKRNMDIELKLNTYTENLKTISKSNMSDKNLIDSKLLETSELSMRRQMRINLEVIGKKIEDRIQTTEFKSMDRDELIDKLTEIVKIEIADQRTYNNEGDWFSLLTIGGYTYFIVDNSNDSSEPRIGANRILTIPNRTRSMYDEVVWQEELKYILSSTKLIPPPPYLKKYNPLDINIGFKYKLDEKLTNVEIFRSKDIEYILLKYPELYHKLKDMNIIMHDEPLLAEKFMDFISYNRSTVDTDRLFWYFHPKPRKEILETYVVPAGFYGFFKQSRTTGAGVFNDNYVKLTLVASAPLHDYQMNEIQPIIDSYNKIFTQNDNKYKDTINDISNLKTKITNFNNTLMLLMSGIFIVCLFFSIFSYAHIPEHILSQDYIDNNICNRCTNNKK